MGVKVKLKKKPRYRISVVLDYDNAPSESFAHEVDAADIDAFIDDADEVEQMGERLEANQEHVTEVMLRITRL